MRNLETNDWLLLNDLTYKIYTLENIDEMRAKLLEQLKLIIDYDSADFYLASPDEKNKLVSPVFYNCHDSELISKEDMDYSKGILYSGNMMIYRETDIMPDEKRVETDYYKLVYKPNGWHYSLQMILAKDKEFVGCITFYRNLGKPDFQYDDIFVLDILKDHLAYRLYNNKKKGETNGEKLSVYAASVKYSLTQREQSVLRLLMDGEDNMSICDRLVITENTLKKHVLNIYRKLGVNNRVGLFKMIREHD